MKHAILFFPDAEPDPKGTVRVPLECIPDSWEAPDFRADTDRADNMETAPAFAIRYRHHSAGYPAANPCARDGADQAAFQHGDLRYLYFVHNGTLIRGNILEVRPRVTLDTAGDYVVAAHWEIDYMIPQGLQWITARGPCHVPRGVTITIKGPGGTLADLAKVLTEVTGGQAEIKTDEEPWGG